MYMKALLLCLTLPLSILAAEPDSDPFGVIEESEIDRSKDLKSKAFLSDQLLKNFGELRMDEIKGGPHFLIRVTVLRSLSDPLMFKLFLNEAKLQVKSLRRKREFPYGELKLNKEIQLTEAQVKLLRILYWNSPITKLPQKDWQDSSQMLDGSRWVYEVGIAGNSTSIDRSNPVNPPLDTDDVKLTTPACLSKEQQLTSFVLTLWALSGIDEKPY